MTEVKLPSKNIIEIETRLKEHVSIFNLNKLHENKNGGYVLYKYELPETNISNIVEKLSDINDVIILTKITNNAYKIAVFDLVLNSNARTLTIIEFDSNKNTKIKNKNNKLINNYNFYHLVTNIKYNEPAFFCVLGPEGAGKTTLCKNIENIFSNYPLDFYQFHHVSEWRYKQSNKYNNENDIKNNSEILRDSKDLLYRRSLKQYLVKFIKFFLPESLNINISAAIGELNYMRNVITILGKTHDLEQIVLSDRYCYDRYVRWKNLNKPFAQRIMSFFTCCIMRRPYQAFILRDDASRIYKRKKSMPEWEIKVHQEMLVNTCMKFNVNYEEIFLQNYDAVALSKLVTAKILKGASNHVFFLLDKTDL